MNENRGNAAAVRMYGPAVVLRTIEEEILRPRRNPELYARFPRRAKTVLLYGAEGAGKMQLCRWVAGELGAEMFCACGSALQTPQSVRELFGRAADAGNSLIAIEEIECMGQGAVVELRMQMESLPGDGVQLMAVTRRPWRIDGLLLRRLAMGCALYLPLPDAERALRATKDCKSCEEDALLRKYAQGEYPLA